MEIKTLFVTADGGVFPSGELADNHIFELSRPVVRRLQEHTRDLLSVEKHYEEIMTDIQSLVALWNDLHSRVQI